MWDSSCYLHLAQPDSLPVFMPSSVLAGMGMGTLQGARGRDQAKAEGMGCDAESPPKPSCCQLRGSPGAADGLSPKHRNMIQEETNDGNKGSWKSRVFYEMQ